IPIEEFFAIRTPARLLSPGTRNSPRLSGGRFARSKPLHNHLAAGTTSPPESHPLWRTVCPRKESAFPRAAKLARQRDRFVARTQFHYIQVHGTGVVPPLHQQEPAIPRPVCRFAIDTEALWGQRQGCPAKYGRAPAKPSQRENQLGAIGRPDRAEIRARRPKP